MATPVLAQQTDVWTGAVSNDLFNADNWSSGVAPSSTDDVLINRQTPNPAYWQTTDSSNYWSVQSLLIGNGGGSNGYLNINVIPNYGMLYASGKIQVGSDGGQGKLDLDFRQGGKNFSLNANQEGLNIGAGTGSYGEVNLLGSGYSVEQQNSSNANGNLSTSQATVVVGSAGGTGVVNVSAAGWKAVEYSAITDQAPLRLGDGAGSNGTINILAGGKLAGTLNGSVNGDYGNTVVVGLNGGTGALNITGVGSDGTPSRASLGGGLTLGEGAGSTGTMNILDGGQMSSFLPLYSPGAPASIQVGVDGGTGNVLVSGAGSTWNIGGASSYSTTENYAQVGDLYVGKSGVGHLTIAEGGLVSIGKDYYELVSGYDPVSGNYYLYYDIRNVGGLGNLYLADQAGSQGTLNIGAAAGEAPTAPGTLDALSVTFGSGDGNVVFNHTDSNYQFSVPLIGHGTLSNIAGTTWLDADNSAFSGDTKLYGGTLGLANNQSLGSTSVEVLDNAALAYANGVAIANGITIDSGAVLTAQVAGSDAATQSGLISGAGGFEKQGDGTLTLVTANTYTGSTTVSAGTLALSGAGSIAESERVVVDGTLDITGIDAETSIKTLAGQGIVEIGDKGLHLTAASDIFAGKLSGSGLFALDAGTEILTGDSSGYTGQANVNNGGTLGVIGKLGGTLDVNNGGTLIGTGTVGQTTIHSGGTISPGYGSSMPATINVNGNLNFEPGAVYVADIVSEYQSDLINVSGQAQLNGATVSLNKASGVYVPGSQWKILSAAAGVSGQFGNLMQELPYVEFVYAYDANNAYLDILRNDTKLCLEGFTSNECATADGAESTGENSPLVDVVASQATEQDAARAFNLLSGEAYASARSILIEDSRFLREAVNNRLNGSIGNAAENATDKENERNGFWAHGFGSWGALNGQGGNTSQLVRDIGGFFMGSDRLISTNWRVGALGGFSRSDFKVNNLNSSGTSDNYHLGLYAGGMWGAFSLRSGLGYTWHDISFQRNVIFPGFSDQSKADYQASTAQIFTELGYRMNAGPVAFEPILNLAYVHLHTDGFTESGGIEALNVQSDDANIGFSTLGVRGYSSLSLPEGRTLTFNGLLGWRHAYGDVKPWSAVSFAGGDTFSIAGVPVARDVLALEAGVDIKLAPALNIGAIYSGQYGDGLRDNGVKAYMNWKF